MSVPPRPRRPASGRRPAGVHVHMAESVLAAARRGARVTVHSTIAGMAASHRGRVLLSAMALVWADAYVVHVTGVQVDPTMHVPPFAGVDPEHAPRPTVSTWVGQMIAARARRDVQAWNAGVDNGPKDPRELAEWLMAFVSMVAATIDTMPAGFAAPPAPPGPPPCGAFNHGLGMVCAEPAGHFPDSDHAAPAPPGTVSGHDVRVSWRT